MRIGAFLASGLLFATGLSGCTVTMGCAGFVGYERPQDAFRDAVLVVAGTVGPANGTVAIDAGDGIGHPLEVEAAYKTVDGSVPSVLRVAVGSDNCGPDRPDPLHDGDRVVLFLTRAGGDWRTLTPFAGLHDWDPGVNPFARTLTVALEPRR